MDIKYIKIIEAFIVFFIFIIVRRTSNKIITRTRENKFMQKQRGEIVKKAINLTFLVVTITIILTILGVNQSDLIVYIGSILTVVGVAFFAQWSILSNITSSIIIFFNHNVKLEDSVTIMEGKEYEIKGKVSNIGLFFVTIITEQDEEITLPNNIFIQKMLKKKRTV
ncbi:mechanosensitive ion channel family protein [uncultured Polaribacter sp.]|uniref:mechanosensitive ion channel domain-containing protein n=1 Tax=uncultured Polaribacter sp. TaxID=174711 RepID=UPI002634716A|nr:mechanosensitive ion channel family protein [uncultured Polaribacter sp.]